MVRNYTDSFWKATFRQFSRHWLGMAGLFVLIFFVLVGIYAPFLASSKPLIVIYDGHVYFPLFRFLFFRGFFTSRLDLFFNLLIFTFPLFLLSLRLSLRYRKLAMLAFLITQTALFLFVAFRHPQDPDADSSLIQKQYQTLTTSKQPITWQFELEHMSSYAKLSEILSYRIHYGQHKRLMRYFDEYERHMRQRGNNISSSLPTVWQAEEDNELAKTLRLNKILEQEKVSDQQTVSAREELKYIQDRRHWLAEQNSKISFILMPLIRPYHWEDDASGEQALNQYLPWWELTRTDRKDLTAALIFGVRISIVVGLTAVALALLIGVPVGSLSGYYAGRTDIFVSRLMEIWEAMPTFFMLLLVISVMQTKSIFLVILIIGFFGWTGFSRYIRGEFFKQRNLPYVEACKAQGFDDRYIIFNHVLPNAVPPLLTLLPFAIMGAISTEAGLSFLGLGEEGSCSWGVLMDEGRRAFPGESYLLWPPAILLTTMLVAIALVGDALRDAIDPRLHKD